MIIQIILNVFLFCVTCLSADAALDKEIAESYKCIKIFPYLEKKLQIPSDTLYSIALKESGKKHHKYKIMIVWPWAVNVDRQSYYFNTKKEAVLFVKKQIIEGKSNIDVGCMQINLKHHLDAFDSLNDAFDPIQNIKYGAKFLKSKYDQLGCWNKAIAYYHSATHMLGFKYQQDVIKIANNMHPYKDSLNKYSGINLYNNISILPIKGTENKKYVNVKDNIRKTIVSNDNKKRYKGNMMISIPRNY